MNLYGDYFLLTPTFFKKNFHTRAPSSSIYSFYKKNYFGLRSLSYTIVDMKPKLISAMGPCGFEASTPRRHVAFLDNPYYVG